MVSIQTAGLLAEIVCLGNELLIGRTVNTNANYIARRLTEEGVRVLRIVTLPDEIRQSSKEIQLVNEREADIIIVTGGLGPTWDDIQVRIVASGLKRQTKKNVEALNWIKKKYTEYGYEMNDARQKMSVLPEGAVPLYNRVGIAPGYLLKIGVKTWFGLPGVPREMESMLEDHIMPEVRKLNKIKGTTFVQLDFPIFNVPESSIAEIIRESVSAFPETYIKSHPVLDKSRPYIVFHLTSYSATLENLIKIREFIHNKIRLDFPNAKLSEEGKEKA